MSFFSNKKVKVMEIQLAEILSSYFQKTKKKLLLKIKNSFALLFNNR